MALKAIELTNKKALVTGSHKGLGASIAVALANAGANVVLFQRFGGREGVHGPFRKNARRESIEPNWLDGALRKI
jgi:NAD(P)-dependent dehydrogenase (short-subunit alcohol dehydrogenase family)